jgi:hypothetical protein
VWTGFVSDHWVGPNVLPHRHTGKHYGHFSYWKLYHWQSRARMWYMQDGAPAHFSRAVEDVLSRTRHDRRVGRAGPASTPDLNRLDFCLCMQLLFATKIHFAIALWMPVRLTATTPASLNGCGSPWEDVSRRALNLMEDILSSYYKSTVSVTTLKCFRAYVGMDIFSCFGMWNSCPKFVRTFQLQFVYSVLNQGNRSSRLLSLGISSSQAPPPLQQHKRACPTAVRTRNLHRIWCSIRDTCANSPLSLQFFFVCLQR